MRVGPAVLKRSAKFVVPGRRATALGAPVRCWIRDVIVHVTGRLDDDATRALAETVNAALAAECSLTLALEPSPDPAPERRPETSPRPASTGRPEEVTSIGAGILRIPTVATLWTLDVPGRRRCTHDQTGELRFMPADAWTPIRSVTISTDVVTAIAACRDHMVSAARKLR